MKKILNICLLVCFVFLLVGCSSAKFESKEEMEFYPYIIKPDGILINDDKIQLTFEWKNKNMSNDGMEKEKFSDTKLLFFATQNGNELNSTDEGDLNLIKEVYSDSFNSVYPTFELKNKKDDVIVTIKQVGMTLNDKEKEITIKMK